MVVLGSGDVMTHLDDGFDDDEPDFDLPDYVSFQSIAWMIPHPREGGQGAFARAAGFTRRSIVRWKRTGRIRIDSADRAAVGIGEHPIMFWPEAFGVEPLPEDRRRLPEAVERERRPIETVRFGTVGVLPIPGSTSRVPPAALRDGAVRSLLAVLGGACSVAEVAEVTGASKAGTHKRLSQLRDAGLVSWADGRARTLRSRVRHIPPGGVTADG